MDKGRIIKFIESLPSDNKANIMERISQLPTNDSLDSINELLEQLQNLEEELMASYHERLRAKNAYIMFGERLPLFRDEYRAIESRRKELNLKLYPNSAHFYDNPMPHPTFSLSWESFSRIVREYCISEQPNPRPDYDLCTDWCKMTPDGESFGGYYESQDPYERENAYTLTEASNRAALAQLPYPYKLIEWTIDYGCSIRSECVAFSRTVCEWFDAMIQKTNILTPEEYNQYKINC
jgi:hypothetical protein